MSRLPNPGGDDGQWGNILNDFLIQALDGTSGALKANSVGTTQIQDGSITASKLSAAGPTSGQVLGYNGSALGWTTPSGSGSVADADGSTKGLVELSGDFSGTAVSPIVAKTRGVAFPASAPSAGQVLTATNASQTSWATPTTGVTSVAGRSGAVTLAEADITNLSSDLSAKASDSAVVHNTGNETVAGTKNFTGTLQSSGQSVVATNDARLSDQRVPTANSVTYAKLSATGATSGQVLSYDGTNLAWSTPTSSGSISDATTSAKGIVQLAGDLAGSAASPSVAKVQGITISATAPSTGQVLTATSSSSANWATPSGGGGGGRTVTPVKSSAYTAVAGDYVIVDATSGGTFNVTLPTGQPAGATVSLKNVSTNSNAILVVPGGSDHIEDNSGSSPNYSGLSVSLNTSGTDMDFVYDGSSRWYRVG